MTHLITVRHSFETAHRLPHLGGKCRNLHGHSWGVEVTVAAPVLTAQGIVVEYGRFKAALRTWIDTWLDHGTMLGYHDRLRQPLLDDMTKLFLFGASGGTRAVYTTGMVTVPEELAAGFDWPTVENVARLLGKVAVEALSEDPAAGVARVAGIRVTETAVNAAEWIPG